MGHATAEFEIKNSEGESVHAPGTTSGTVGTVVAYPVTPDKMIEEFEIENKAPVSDEYTSLTFNMNSELYVSIDNVNFQTIYAGQSFKLRPKGKRQIFIKANVANLPFDLVTTFEKFNEVQ